MAQFVSFLIYNTAVKQDHIGFSSSGLDCIEPRDRILFHMT